MTAATNHQESSMRSTQTAGTIDCRISMRTALRRFMHGSTIENGAVDIRGRSAVAETPRMSICGYWRMAAVIFCIWQEQRGTERWKPLNSTSP